MTSYDDVPYTTHSYPQTHPDRLAVIARLFGLSPAPITRCRVLEIGCGDGSNLVPMAWSLSESEFVGVDLASRPIATGNEMLKELGIRNVELLNADITAANDTLGRFDYIIAHGFYSWVPAQVRDHLMRVCRELLTPEGVAFVSYNAYPGCHARMMLREMLLFHVRNVQTPADRTRQARAFLSLLAGAQSGRDAGQWMLGEIKGTQDHTDAHLYHDDLAEINEPRYFVQFIEHAAAHGLKYLGEADYFEMSDHTFPANVRAVLEQIRGDRIVREQYLDFLKFRRFRQTLLCHEEAQLLNSASGAAIPEFLISSTAVARGERTNDNTQIFETPKGARAETDYEGGVAALEILQERAPRAVPFAELALGVVERLRERGIPAGSGDALREELSGFLLSIYSAGVVEFHTHVAASAAHVGERPLASPIARWQAERGNMVTTLHHDTVHIEGKLEKELLLMLDGTRDRAALREELLKLAEGAGALEAGEAPQLNPRDVDADLEKNLQKLARLGLLVAI